jgi:hypothetical protein
MWYERHPRKLTLRENRNRTKEKTMDYQTSASKYLVRTYGIEKGAIMLETDTMSDTDRKMIQSMMKLATSYKSHKDNKARTIQLNYRPILAVLNSQKPPTKTKKPIAVLICRATKMNGDKCMAKVKQGAFCARHSKKVN